jgi:hypothetical protein
VTGALASDPEYARFEQRVHAAIAANVDLMSGPPRVVEQALRAARHAERRRRLRRRVVVIAAAGLCFLVALALARRS